MCGCRVKSGERVIDPYVSKVVTLEDSLKGKLENQKEFESYIQF